MIAAAKNNLNKDETKDRLSNEQRRSLKRIIKEGEDWLQANPDEEAEVYNDKNKDLQQSLAPLLTDQKSKMNMDKEDDEDNDDDDDDDVDDDEFGET
ncbi:hypothetical protein TVAG_473410 [Trichomonas vaginalis G3]|uniref:Uncharacterized protein n=1 Tax=Trichomonas vaginalis (strain ATCC PRA-98 / G3) TaxID=412133 RepID=A2EUF8_TRIV3|nr:ATP binding [Trichomonas vaginalis G3]EAY03717.1 hypothetical protein TVAG_473410 [Trichomonas vaginalis G3]KAI5529019.1 ATP binding [Trichomonas vaginalis G3]|eukprot:XP_001315940.1 hypothetical protein [Trichomonas vaginalis G3]